MKIINNEEGSVLPIIAVILILFIFVGAYEIGNIFVYRDRAVVGDAIDSAVTSALAVETSVQSHDTTYYETFYPFPLGGYLLTQSNLYSNKNMSIHQN